MKRMEVHYSLNYIISHRNVKLNAQNDDDINRYFNFFAHSIFLIAYKSVFSSDIAVFIRLIDV